MKQEPFKREIKVELNDQEKIEVADKLVEVMNEINALQVEKADLAKQYKDHIDNKLEIMKEYARLYRQGYRLEKRDVVIQKDYDAKKILYVDPKTSEILDEAEMTDEQKQMGIEEIAESGGDYSEDAKEDDFKSANVSYTVVDDPGPDGFGKGNICIECGRQLEKGNVSLFCKDCEEKVGNPIAAEDQEQDDSGKD